MKIPSAEIRLAYCVTNRCFMSGGIAPDSLTDQRSTAFEFTLFAFWPPGPGERANENRNSERGIDIFSLTYNMVSILTV